ncbi:unnamed protein product, partial [Mesorhabditis spiculigera]
MPYLQEVQKVCTPAGARGACRRAPRAATTEAEASARRAAPAPASPSARATCSTTTFSSSDASQVADWELDQERAVRKLVRFKSSRLSERRLEKWSKKVEERMQRRQAVNAKNKILHAFATAFPSSSSERSKEAAANKKSASTPTDKSANRKNSGTPGGKRFGNPGPDGKAILESGQPFWVDPNADEEAPTDSTLPLNADVMLDVLRGKITLKPMPNVPVKLDPMGKLEDLERMQPFFDSEIIYGNTVRSMINASETVNTRSSDQSERSQRSKSSMANPANKSNQRKRKSFKITEPTFMMRYSTPLKNKDFRREEYRHNSSRVETSSRRSGSRN